jgi:hypothetical protein
MSKLLTVHKKRSATEKGKLPVYRDTRLNNLLGEKWQDIPGLDGYYLVSSLGRIKRREREVVYPNGSYYILPEKIILPRKSKTFNKYMQDYVYGLHAHLTVEGKRYHLPIRRLVYHCFVKPFALDDLSVTIVVKKGDGLDMRSNNLQMIDTSARNRRMYDTGRMVSIFRLDSYRQQGVLASLSVTRRQVSQYDKKGRRIKTFASISDAARATGLRPSRISHVANELEPTAGGFFWRFGKEKTFDVKGFLASRRQRYTEKRGTKVTQYDAQGNPIAYYLSLQDAGRAINGHWTSISAVIRGKHKTAYGFRWKKGYHKRKIKPLSINK